MPELEDMVKQQYFSKQEVKQVVKRRQDFEYLLKRKAALKEDFLRCVEELCQLVRGGSVHAPVFAGRGACQARQQQQQQPPWIYLTTGCCSGCTAFHDRYIEYESKLDALRVHRRQALGLEGAAMQLQALLSEAVSVAVTHPSHTTSP